MDVFFVVIVDLLYTKEAFEQIDEPKDSIGSYSLFSETTVQFILRTKKMMMVFC